MSPVGCVVVAKQTRARPRWWGGTEGRLAKCDINMNIYYGLGAHHLTNLVPRGRRAPVGNYWEG